MLAANCLQPLRKPRRQHQQASAQPATATTAAAAAATSTTTTTETPHRIENYATRRPVNVDVGIDSCTERCFNGVASVAVGVAARQRRVAAVFSATSKLDDVKSSSAVFVVDFFQRFLWFSIRKLPRQPELLQAPAAASWAAHAGLLKQISQSETSKVVPELDSDH